MFFTHVNESKIINTTGGETLLEWRNSEFKKVRPYIMK